LESIRGSDNWLYFVPQANNKTVIKIKNEIGQKVLPVPAIEEPTIPTHNSNRFFGELFRA
jgi:hypothetical protein